MNNHLVWSLRPFVRWAHIFVLGLVLPALRAQVPQLLNYQGRVAVAGNNFTGTGQFKFALVDGTGATTYWSNDGTSTAGSEPTAAVSLAVNMGLYSVLLGDTTLPHMTAIPVGTFANSDVRLRVWFDDGTHGSQLLTPDQRIAAVGYAMMAGQAQTVPDGAITSAKLALGAAAANLSAGGQAAVPSGGIILSATEHNSDLLAAGYVKIGTTQMNERWQQETTPGAPATRYWHTAVWTGSEMIVWGGFNGDYLNDGGRYNPAMNTWTTLPTSGAPEARAYQTAVWTGGEMIVWGGGGISGPLKSGGRYNPAADTWTALPTTGAPSAREVHTAVWTGSEMIVWGGFGYGGVLNDGGRYNPAADTWTALPTAGAPSARDYQTAVWTGSEMIVWGGEDMSGSLNDGGRYNPSANTWTALPTTGAPSARILHTAVWTGGEMIIWGGYGLNDGGRYNPAMNTWTALPTTGTPSVRSGHTSVWTGSEMIIWGGYGYNGGYLNDGGRYNPTANTWTAVTTSGAPSAREIHTAVWTGSEMIVWGGINDGSYLNDTWSYTPDRTLYFYLKP